MNKEKFKVLIDSIKTANELMRKQIEINGRAVELLGEFITEPETLGKAPHSDNVPTLSGFNMVGQEIELGNEWVKDETIKPEDMKAREWYVVEVIGSLLWLIKVRVVETEKIYTEYSYNLSSNNQYNGSVWFNYPFCSFKNLKSIRKATQQEVLKYFPNELEVPTHGGNDAAYIQEVTNTQIK